MSELVVIGFEDEHTAFEMRATLAKLQKEYLIEMEDVVVVTKDEKEKVKLHQAMNLTAAGIGARGFSMKQWGCLRPANRFSVVERKGNAIIRTLWAIQQHTTREKVSCMKT